MYDVGERTTTISKIPGISNFPKFDIFDVSIDCRTLLLGDTLAQELKVINIDTKTEKNLNSFQKSKFTNARFSPKSGDVYIAYTTNRFIIASETGKVKFESSRRIPPKIHQLYNKFYSFAFGGLGKLLVYSKYSLYKFELRGKKHATISQLPETQLFGKNEKKNSQNSLEIFTTEKPIARVKEFGKDFVMVNFNWDSAMSDIPQPVITKRFG